MDRLHALDAAFLELEEPGPPLSVGVASVLDGPCPPVAAVRSLVRERLSGMHRLEQRVDSEHGGLHRQAWVDVADLDLREHVSAARAPGGDLDAFVGAAMERPLPHDRPLWYLDVVRGLPDGRWALVWRVHHTIADGVGTMILLGHVFDLAPGGGGTLADAVLAAGPRTARSAAAKDPGRPDDADGIARAAVSALGAVIGGASRALGQLPDLARAVGAAAPRPPGDLTGPLSARRRWRSGTAAVADAKRVRRALGGTVNDVVLAAVTTGYRDLLLSRGDPLDGRHLRVLVPVNLRAGGDDSSVNKVSALVVTLPVGQPDPVRRLAEVTESTQRLKDLGAPVVGSVLLGLVDALVPAAVQDAVVTHATGVPEWFVETVVTNVPGPQFPLWVLGRRVRTLTPIIPIGGHLRVTVGVLSYDGDIDISVTGDGVHASDVDVLLAGIARGLDELVELAGQG